MTSSNAAANNNITPFDRIYAATIRRQSWSQTRAIERRIRDAEPIWTAGNNGDSEPWDWIRGEYTTLYHLPKYGYIIHHRTGAAGSEAVRTDDGGYVGGSALYAVTPDAINMLVDGKIRPHCENLADYLQYNAIELAHSRS